MTVRRMRNTVMSRDTTTYGKLVSGSVVRSAPQEDHKPSGLGLETSVFRGLSLSFVVYGLDLLVRVWLVFIVLTLEVPGLLR
jgi:hypothetical protein